LDLSTVLPALYERQLNCSISCFWDSGWDVKLGDELNGFVAEGNVSKVEASGFSRSLTCRPQLCEMGPRVLDHIR
jgi:hypothetical protein